MNPIFLLIPVMALLLVSAQALWSTAIKDQHLFNGSVGRIASNLLSSPRIWLGAAIYIVATLVYFFLLSRVRFFSVQVAMTATAIVFSTILAAVLFHERLSTINVLGMVIILVGIPCVLWR